MTMMSFVHNKIRGLGHFSVYRRADGAALGKPRVPALRRTTQCLPRLFRDRQLVRGQSMADRGRNPPL